MFPLGFVSHIFIFRNSNSKYLRYLLFLQLILHNKDMIEGICFCSYNSETDMFFSFEWRNNYTLLWDWFSIINKSYKLGLVILVNKSTLVKDNTVLEICHSDICSGDFLPCPRIPTNGLSSQSVEWRSGFHDSICPYVILGSENFRNNAQRPPFKETRVIT